jgi:hypothetical protein
MLCWLLLVVGLFFTTLHAALPPGYEDVHYCRPNHCIVRRADIREAYSGSYGCINECCDMADGTRTPVRSWGKLVGPEVREGYIRDGLVESQHCAEEHCPQTNGFFIAKSPHALLARASRH